MISNYLTICAFLVLPHCHGFIMELIGMGRSRPDKVAEQGECAHWGSVNPYASPFTTQTGELFDRDDLIAAHRTLPIGSYATVTNQLNGRSVVVRITGRGPFSEGRLMEVSPGAFNQISDTSEAVIPCSVAVKANAGVNPNLSGIFPVPDLQSQSGYPHPPSNQNQPGYSQQNTQTRPSNQNPAGYPRPGSQNRPGYSQSGY